MKEFMLACVLLPALVVRALAGSTIKAILFGCGAIIVVNILAGYLFLSLVGHNEIFPYCLLIQAFAFTGGFCAWTMIFLGKGVLFCLIELLVFLVAALITGNFFTGVAACFMLSFLLLLQRGDMNFFIQSRLLKRNKVENLKFALPQILDAEILILTASQGSGHMVAALNIAEKINQMMPEKKVSCVNLFDYLDEKSRKWLEIYWQYAVLNLPNFYRALHRIILKDAEFYTRRMAERVAILLERSLKKSPITIIATHPLGVKVGSILKGKIDGKLIVVPTDYMVHRHFVAENVDFYCLPDLDVSFVGVDKDLILQKGLPTGIPVSQDYCFSRVKLNIPDKKIAVFLNFGRAGLGVKHETELISFLAFNEHPFYFLVSKEASEELIGIVESYCKEDSYALVDNMPSALNACDVVIGKAGGMSISEALASGKPFGIWVHNGPEDFNTEYLVRKKFGKKIGGTVELLRDFKETKQWILSIVQQGKSAFAPKDGADKIAKLALDFF